MPRSAVCEKHVGAAANRQPAQIRGTKGSRIRPLGEGAIADFLDGLVSDGLGTDEIGEAFAKESGAMFDPNLVDLLLTQL